MNVTAKLASSVNRRDEAPNVKLAEEIAAKNDTAAVQELINNLHHAAKAIRHDSIKVLYETGNRKPELIAAYHAHFLELIASHDNRMIWGAMAALDSMVAVVHGAIGRKLYNIAHAANNGSVITRDHAVSIFIKLSSISRNAKTAFNLLLEQLTSCPVNQLPMYAEKSLLLTSEKQRASLVAILKSRLHEMDTESKRRRLQAVVKKLSGMG